MSNTVWTDELSEKARVVCLEEIATGGHRGYMERSAKRLGIHVNSLQNYLYRIAPWRDEIRAARKDTPVEVSPPKEIPVAEAIPPDHPQLRAWEREREAYKSETRNLRRKLKEADADRTIIDQCGDILREVVEPLPLGKHTPPKQKPGSHPVDAVALLSDEHADEIVTGPQTWGLERSDFNIFRVRFTHWLELVYGYASGIYRPSVAVERLWIYSLGDKVNGDIHGAKLENHFQNSLRAAVALGDLEAQGIAWLADNLLCPIDIVAVSGNHARQSAKKNYGDPHDNLDYLVSVQIATRLQRYIDSGRVTIHAPRSWTAYVRVRDRHVHALNHGDDVIGYAGHPWYGFSRKHNRVQALVRQHNENVTGFFHGHYHTPVMASETGAKSYHAGAWKFSDDYAIEKVSAGNEPEQQMFYFDDARPHHIAEYPLYLRHPEREEAYRDGEYDPPFGRLSVLDTLAESDVIANEGRFPAITGGERR